MPVHDAIPKRKRLNGQLQLFTQPLPVMAGRFASYGRLKHRTDEYLSMTLAGIGGGGSRSGKALAAT
ncbi:hypothetical protein EGY08_18330 [Klebsiella sp. FDAARGOS_511]|nr:hypothetical protein EGY08_18330 [Klebsiella sp. FDAARGOS_511]